MIAQVTQEKRFGSLMAAVKDFFGYDAGSLQELRKDWKNLTEQDKLDFARDLTKAGYIIGEAPKAEASSTPPVALPPPASTLSAPPVVVKDDESIHASQPEEGYSVGQEHPAVKAA